MRIEQYLNMDSQALIYKLLDFIKHKGLADECADALESRELFLYYHHPVVLIYARDEAVLKLYLDLIALPSGDKLYVGKRTAYVQRRLNKINLVSEKQWKLEGEYIVAV